MEAPIAKFDSLGSMPETYIVEEDQFWKFLLASYARHVPNPITTSKQTNIQTYIHTYIHKKGYGSILRQGPGSGLPT